MRTLAIVAALTLCGFSAADWRYTPDWAQPQKAQPQERVFGEHERVFGESGAAFGVAWLSLSIGVALYFLPSIVAARRKHANNLIWGIFLLNLFLGWTFLGWLAALIWAASLPAKPARPDEQTNPNTETST